MRHIGILLALVAGTLGLQSPAHAADMDCADFASQQAAQLFFLNHNPAADPHGLDADNDGVVCESQGPPYYYGSDPTPGGDNNPPPSAPKPKPIKVVKVLGGDLLKLRQEGKPAYKVRLVGAQVRGDSCVTQGARADLRSWIKPGRIVRVEIDKRAPRRDKQGNMHANVVTKRGSYTIGGTQIGAGWATVARYRFSDRARYERWAGQASYRREGMYGECIPNFGSATNPYAVGTAFDLGPWRYQFAATDGDALPEMQAEKVVYSAPPSPGWVYVRVAVTVTRIAAGAGSADWTNFHLQRDGKDYDKFGASYNDWCGTAPTYINGQTLSQGQSFTGYLCATIPAPLQPQDSWVVDSEDFKTERHVAVG